MDSVTMSHDAHAGDDAQAHWNLPTSLDVSDGSGVSLGGAPLSPSLTCLGCGPERVEHPHERAMCFYRWMDPC